MRNLVAVNLFVLDKHEKIGGGREGHVPITKGIYHEALLKSTNFVFLF